MHALKARVQNGRYVIDEPADLPEGSELILLPVDEGDDLDDEEREELHASIREGIADVKAGRVIDGDEALERIRRAR